MHPNDTLNGKLFAWEHDDQKHLRNCFGYWDMVEKRMVRAQLIAEGHNPESPLFGAEMNARIAANHALDVSYRDTSRALLNAAQPAPPTLSPTEWAFLAEHFQGANHPIAQAILAKALARLPVIA